jgi:5S rRNA maturation endonuclease (ribonuclease M5)
MQHSDDEETFIKALNNLKAYTVIVEGKRDKNALISLGLDDKKIIAINGRTPIKVVEQVRASGKDHNHVIILTDFDEKGRQIASKLMRLFLAYKIHPNSRLRKEMMKFGRAEIEDLGSFLPADIKLRGDDIHGKIGTNVNKVRNKGKDKGKRSNREA